MNNEIIIIIMGMFGALFSGASIIPNKTYRGFMRTGYTHGN